MRRPIAIEVLYFDGCPNSAGLVRHLQALSARAGVAAEVTPRVIESEDEARRLRFLGSPTVRVGGRDIEPGADARTDFGLVCRLYRTVEGTSGAPPDTMALAALGVA